MTLLQRFALRLIASCFLLGVHAVNVSASESTALNRTAVGVATIGMPALSLQLERGETQAYHALIHYGPASADLKVDYQYFLTTAATRRNSALSAFGFKSSRLRPYVGVGLAGSSKAEHPNAERYDLRLPLGLQLDWTVSHIGLFVEIAAQAGPMPKMNISPAFAAGTYAFF